MKIFLISQGIQSNDPQIIMLITVFFYPSIYSDNACPTHRPLQLGGLRLKSSVKVGSILKEWRKCWPSCVSKQKQKRKPIERHKGWEHIED